MKPLLIVLPLLVVGLSSCDKAKQAADAVRAKMGGVTDPGAPAVPGGDVTPDLASQVDSAAEGVRFRRDLPFPSNVSIRIVERSLYKNVQMVSTSALGKESGTANGTWEEISLMEREGGRVTVTLEKSGKVIEPVEGEAKDSPAPVAKDDSFGGDAVVTGVSLEFELGPKGWRTTASKGPADFQSKILTDDLLPVLPDTLSEHGALPRTQWFSSSRRWLGGDKIVLEGDAVNLVFAGKHTSGKLTLVYEASEALEGHPCGRFAVSGDITLKGDVGFSGKVANTEMTINSGTIWCSLIHPLVLREEFDTVCTSVEGKGGGPKRRVQGSIGMVVARQWKP